MNRREARELTMTHIFQMEAQKDFTQDSVEKFLKDKALGSQQEYAKTLLEHIVTKITDIDAAIEKSSQGWTISRMAKTDLAVVRLATAEILYMEDIPMSVSINEAVELAKLYGGQQSPKFVNAVLKNIG